MLFLDRNLAAAGKARPAGSGMSGTLCVETPDTPSVPWTKGLSSQQEMMDHPTDTQTQWYAMRVFGNRIFRIKEEAEGLGAQTYLALRTESGVSCPGGRQRVQIVPSLLFVRWDLDRLNAFKQAHFTDLMIYRRADSTEPAPVDEAQMRMFMLVTSALDGRDIEFVGEHFDFKPGERVRVTGGPYAGTDPRMLCPG